MEGEKEVANNQVEKEEPIRGETSWETQSALTNKNLLDADGAFRTAKNTRSKTRLRTLNVYSLSTKRTAAKRYTDDNMISIATFSRTHI